MAQIRFEKTSKRFGELIVIRGLDLTIREGEFFTFVGPSGCGKSTILNMIAGLEPISGGRIFFDDNAVNELSPRERDVAMVFQSYALYPHMSVYENMAFPLRMKKRTSLTIDGEVKRIAQLLGLGDLLHRKPKELSGGQRQRVALGRAIIRRPKVFLMDEPLSNLDARLRIEMREELKRLHQDLKITMVYVTHDQAEAMSLSDRMAILDQGEIQQCGTPPELYLRPSNTFVAGFIGSPSMNLMPSYIRRSKPAEIDCNGTILFPAVEGIPEHGKVIVGIRPEDVAVSAKKGEKSIAVTISIIEPAGPFNWVDVTWNNIRLKGRGALEEDMRPGEEAFMEFSPDKVILFDPVSGENLTSLI